MGKFDSKIKTRLDNLPVDGMDEAWTKLAPSLPRPWYTNILTAKTLGFVAAMLTGVVIYQFFKIQDLKNQNVEIISKQHILNNKAPKSTTTLKTDTIYIEKIITNPVGTIVENTTFQKQIPKSNRKSTNTSSMFKHSNEVSHVSKSTNANYTQKLSFRNTNSKNNTEIKTTHLYSHDQPDSITNPKTISSIPLETSITIEKEIPTADSNQNHVASIESNEGVQKDVPKPIDSLSLKQLEEHKTDAVSDSLKINDPTKKHTKPSKLGTLLKKTPLYIGFGSTIKEVENLRYGPILELGLLKKLHFQTGILFYESPEKTYKKTQDFNKVTGQQFEKKYDQHVKEKRANDEILDIKTRQSIVFLPLNLNYFYPINSNFDFMVSAGALTYLSKTEQVVYQKYSQDTRTLDLFSSNINSKNTSFFYNYNYGMGVRYSYRKISVSLLPNFEFLTENDVEFYSKRKFSITSMLKLRLN
ncbi:MAG: hypothetical protein ACRCVT_09240 [Leadbetterella sp.]